MEIARIGSFFYNKVQQGENVKKELILFDLDGTLTNPMVGITKSVQYALRHYGILEDSLEKLIPFIGPPLRESFMKYYDFSREQAEEAVFVYREYFSDKGIFENEEIPGIREMLRRLKEEEKVLMVATSKPELYARQIIEKFEMEEFFAFIGGADMGETRTGKGEVIRYVLEQNGICKENCLEEKKEIVMVGDREHDIFGAKENNLSSVGVLFGFGSRKELECAGADRIAADAEELTQILLMDWK